MLEFEHVPLFVESEQLPVLLQSYEFVPEHVFEFMHVAPEFAAGNTPPLSFFNITKPSFNCPVLESCNFVIKSCNDFFIKTAFKGYC